MSIRAGRVGSVSVVFTLSFLFFCSFGRLNHGTVCLNTSGTSWCILFEANGDLAAFKTKRNYAIRVMNEATHNYYKQFIEENGDDRSKLFRASK